MNDNINIHTLEFSYFYLPDSEHRKLIKTLKKQKENEEIICFAGFSSIWGIRYKYIIVKKNDYNNRILKVIINPSQFLNKQHLTRIDYFNFIKKYYTEISKELSPQTINTEKFTRIDYYYDVILPEKTREILLKIYNKAPATLNRLEKKNKYKTSVYYKSKSKCINIYNRYDRIVDMMLNDNFKDVENVDIETEIDPYIDEGTKNTLRYEVQIKRSKLRYCFKQYGTIINLFNYWNSFDSLYFLSEILKPLVFEGDYYNSYHTRKKLKEIYNEKLVEKLITFQNHLSKYGFSKTKEKYKNYRQLIKYLTDVKVNPYLIPNNEKVTHIKNPLEFLDKPIDAYTTAI
jgi:hypothetical protein